MSPRPRPDDFPDAVLFDLDGTLVDREPLATAALEEVMEGLGAPLAPGRSSTWIGRGWPDVHRDLDVEARHGLTFVAWHRRVRATADRLVDDGFPTKILDGGPDLVDRLVSCGVTVGIVTGSTHAELSHAVALLGLQQHLSVLVAAEDYGAGKPSPEPYLTALDRLAVLGTDVDRWVVVEDSTAGVCSGLAAGAGVVATAAANPPIGHPGHQDLSAAHVVVAGLHEVGDEVLIAGAVSGGSEGRSGRPQGRGTGR